MIWFQRILVITTILTLCVVVFGSYVRLTDAGLGCPDWPGCYGKLSPFHAETEIDDAQRLSPAGPVSATKAWNEMFPPLLGALGWGNVGANVVPVPPNPRPLAPGSECPKKANGLPSLLL